MLRAPLLHYRSIHLSFDPSILINNSGTPGIAKVAPFRPPRRAIDNRPFRIWTNYYHGCNMAIDVYSLFMYPGVFLARDSRSASERMR